MQPIAADGVVWCICVCRGLSVCRWWL